MPKKIPGLPNKQPLTKPIKKNIPNFKPPLPP